METYLDYGLAAQVITPYDKIQSANHQDIECSFIDKGSITYLLGTDPITISAGRWIIFWAAIPHHIIHTDMDAQLYWMTIPLSRFLQWQLPEHIVDPVMNGQMMTDVRGDLKLDKAMVKRWSVDLDLNSEERHEIVLLELEARIRRLAFYAEVAQTTSLQNQTEEDNTSFQTARHMANYISEYYMGSLVPHQVAETADLETSVADRLFQKYFHSTLSDYIMRYRVAHAQRLLVATDLSLQAIATRSGFESVSNFYDVFKSACHHTPKAYRSQFSIA